MKIKTTILSKTLKNISSKWVALSPITTKVIAVGMTPKSVMQKAKKMGTNNPVLTRVPKNYGTYIL